MPDYTEQPRAASGTPKGNARPKVRERGRWGPQVSLVEVWPVSVETLINVEAKFQTHST